MSKIKVAHYCKSISYSGTDRTAQVMCKYLDKSRFEVFYLYNSNAAKERLEIVQKELGSDHVIEIHHVDQINPPPPYIPLESNFFDIVHSLNLDILHIHHGGSYAWPFFPRIKEVAKKLVTTEIFGLSNLITGFLVNKKIYICPYIWKRAGSPTNCEILRNPVEVPTSNENLRKELGLSSNEIVLGRIGRPDNFAPISLNALKVLKEKWELTPKYLIVNPCNNWKRVAEENGVLDQCIFLDSIYNDEYLSMFYNTIDILAHARSDGEVDSVTLSQSFIHGKPVVTHVSGGYNGQIFQVIESNAGLYANLATDCNGYAAALYLLMKNSDMRQNMAKNAVSYAKENLEASLIIKKLENIYGGLL